MYSILLVEDEILELETLKNYVDWSKIGIDKVYTARGSRSALACITENEPDIILSDIQMPGMNGIELAQLIREEGYKCKIVFLTGYDKFEYAKAAVQVHAEDFLLKPFQVEEVERLMVKIIEKIKQERQTNDAAEVMIGKSFEDLCLGKLCKIPDVLYSYFQKTPEEVSIQICAISTMDTEDKMGIEKLPEVIHGFHLEHLYIILLYPQIKKKEFEKSLMEYVENDVIGIFYDNPIRLTELHSAIKLILQYESGLFFGEKGKLYEWSKVQQWAQQSNVIFKTTRISIMQAILQGREDEAVKLAETYLTEYKYAGKECCIRGTYGLFVYLRDYMLEEVSGSTVMYEKFLGIDEPELLCCLTFFDMKENILKYLKECCKIFQTEIDDYYVEMIKKYINENYATDCNVEEMAEIIGFSPNYIRKKFKKSTGMTILEYVTEVRLQKAKLLLKDHRFKVKDVSLQVGYDNISYFTHLFKKKNGVTPNEYKNMVYK